MEIDLDRVRRWIPFDIQRFMADPKVRRMPTLTRSVYAYLLITMWESSEPVGTLPDDDAEIARFLDLPEWPSHAAAIRLCFVADSGTLHQRGMQEIWKQQVKKYQQKITASASALHSRRRSPAATPPPADTDDDAPPADAAEVTSPPPPPRAIKPVDPEARRKKIEEDRKKLMAEAGK